MFKTPHQTPGEQYALATVLPLVATFFVGLRFLARHLRKNSLLWDDWLVVVALVSLRRCDHSPWAYDQSGLYLCDRGLHDNRYAISTRMARLQLTQIQALPLVLKADT